MRLQYPEGSAVRRPEPDYELTSFTITKPVQYAQIKPVNNGNVRVPEPDIEL